MKPLYTLSVIAIFAIVFTTGCRKDLTSEDTDPAMTAAVASDAKTAFAEKLKKLSPDKKRKLTARATLLMRVNTEYKNRVLNALNAAPEACNDNTAVSQWLDAQLQDWNADVVFYVLFTAMLDLPTYDALVFENSSQNQVFGRKGEFSKALQKSFKDLKRFWNIDASGIQLVAMHGRMLQDRTRLIRTYMAVYGLSRSDAEQYADLVLDLLKEFPQYRNGDHPIFTFNAVALKGFTDPVLGTVPSKIVMGDGLLEGLSAIGYGDVAPQAILAHEFGHHVQFQLNVFGDEEGPEATRRTELMADALAAYFLAHSRGQSMQWKRVKQFLQVFFNIGDCQFENDAHHGTPTQRMAAAEWAYRVVENAQKQGHILPAQQLIAMFEKALPDILAH